MSYDRQVYAQITKEYENIQDTQRRNLEIKKEEVYSKIPRIKEIDEALASMGLNLTRKILDKGANTDEVVEQIRQKNIDLNMEKGELLGMHGYPVNYLDLKYNCKKCKDTGYINTDMCECFKKKLIQNAYYQSNLASILESQNFDNFDFTYYSDIKNNDERLSPRENTERIFQHCIDFVNHFDKTNENILFYGGTGLGKTFLSSCIAKDLLDKGKTVFYESSYKIFNILENYKFNKSQGPSDKQKIDRFLDADLLIIDDLGSEFINTYTSSAFFNILNTRLINKQKMVISTNLNMEELNNLYSERVVSRIFGHFLTFKFYGEDIRKQKMLQ